MTNQNINKKSMTWFETLAAKEEKKAELMQMYMPVEYIKEENLESKMREGINYLQNLLNLQLASMELV